MTGVLVLDKPAGFTSFDAVAVLRRLCGEKKIGHTGTLDPMATGVLPLLLGKATRAASLIEDKDKTYQAQFQLGVETDTQDRTGKVTGQNDQSVCREQILAVLPQFRGQILQMPPMYSAVHKDGRRLYELARQGITVEREKRPVTIYRLELGAYDETLRRGSLTVCCSAGTYIRTLCAEIGQTVGTGAMMTDLRRTHACGFSLDDAVTIDQARALAQSGGLQEHILAAEKLFAAYPAVQVTEPQTVRFLNGGGLALERLRMDAAQCLSGARIRVLSPQKIFLGLGAVNAEKGELSVLKLFAE